MLIDTIKSGKRIKERILFHLNAPRNEASQDPFKLEGSTNSKSKKSAPRAVIQTLNFLAMGPVPSEEDTNFRDNLSNYFFDDDKETPNRIGIPYLVLEEEDFRRHGNLKSSYPILQGKPLEVADYIVKETGEFYKTKHQDTQEAHNESSQDDESEDLETTFATKVYPISGINIPIPWVEGGTDFKTCINLPTEQETAKICDKLTNMSKSQLTIFLSGPHSEVGRYHQSLMRELEKEQGIKEFFQIASIKINEGYLCASKKLTVGESEALKNREILEPAQPGLKEVLEELKNNAQVYIENLLKKKEIEKVWNKKAKEKDPQGFEAARYELEAIRKEISHYEEIWSKLRKASHIELSWKSAELNLKGLEKTPRMALMKKEEELEKQLGELVQSIHEAKNNSKKPENLINKVKALETKIKSIVDSWFKFQENLLNHYKELTKDISYEPWGLRVIHIRNRMGFVRPMNWEGPIIINCKNWRSKQFDQLENMLSSEEVQENHLSRTQFTGAYDKKNQPIFKLIYPKTREKRIANPKQFIPLPEELKGQSLEDCFKGSNKDYSIKLDTRLSPRPSLETELLLENDNLQIELYNPVAGRPTGFKDATLWRPILTRKGIPYVENSLKEFGYSLKAEPAVFNFAERKVKQAEKCLSPNYPLTSYESLAYFENGPRIAEATVVHPDTGECLWIEGKTYHITPSWKRQTMMVDHSVEEETEATQLPANVPQMAGAIAADLDKIKTSANAEDIVTLGQTDTATRINNSARIQTLTERRINYGFATFIVEAEGNKTYEIKETVSKETLSMEKERLAMELDHLMERLEELEKKPKRTRVENNEIKKLEDQIEEKTKELDTWAPMIEDFLTAFPPEAPALTTEVYDEKIRSVMKRIYSRFAPFIKTSEGTNQTSLKDYQLKWAAIGAVKRGHANSSSPGSGKTIMSIMSSWEMGHHYNWVICPTIAMKTWAKELERVGLYHEIVGFKKSKDGQWVQRPGVYGHIKELTSRFHRRERMKNRLGKIEPEYYIISAEAVSLGGEGNKIYSPWHYDYWVTNKQEKLHKELRLGSLKLPDHWVMVRKEKGTMIRVWSDRSDNSKEIAKHGFKPYLRPVKFHRAVKECPRCGAGAPTWSKHGFCNQCKHSHNTISKQKSGWDMQSKSPLLKGNWLHMTTKPIRGSKWEGEKTSNKQYPLYKLMGKHVGCKIIDEVHNWSNFHSQHGAALLQVKSKDCIILSGTLCKTHISELEPSLCQIYEANSGEFPYSPWGMDLFKEQFQTLEIESSYRTRTDVLEDIRQVRRNTREKVVPEASNLTKLRALLHGIMCSVGETEMERVWDIKPINESIRYVELQQENAEIYQEWERLMKDAYSDCKTEHEKIGMLRKARGQLTNLAYACDGPEKLEAAIAWIQEGMASGKRNVIVGPSTRFYTMLCRALKEREIPFMSMGSMAPEKRFDFLNKFRDSDCPNFVSRIRLVNVNFNQLTCATRILFTGIDPSPAAIRQMQKRLNRIGQKETVECTFLVTQLPPRQRTTMNNLSSSQGIAVDPQSFIDGQQYTTESIEQAQAQEEISEYRPLSYEERLFGLVLRRENAIKQTLQQADRQRDPQELYEMLKDRQTLNQLLQDIVEDTKNDSELKALFKGTCDEAWEKTSHKTESNISPKQNSLEGIISADYTQQKVLEIANKNIGNKFVKFKLSAENILADLPELPPGYKFNWKEIKSSSNTLTLQGELF
jgi:truncated hemoglobin YjbI/Fe-S-cluster containining protein